MCKKVRGEEEAKPEKTTRTITFGRIVTTAGEQFALSVPEHFDFSGFGRRKAIEHRRQLPRAPRRVGASDLRRESETSGARLPLENRSLTYANYSAPTTFETELLWLMNSVRTN